MIFSPQVSPTRWNQLIKTCTNVDTLVAVLPSLMSHNYITSWIIPQIFCTETVSLPSGYSDTSIPSGDADLKGWDTNPDENPFHPVHFDNHGYQEDPITASYGTATYPWCDDNNNSHSYVGKKSSKPDKTFYMRAFNNWNFTDQESKEYSYWYKTKLDAQPPAGLITLYVADYYCQEITLIDKQQKSKSSTCRILTAIISCLVHLIPTAI